MWVGSWTSFILCPAGLAGCCAITVLKGGFSVGELCGASKKKHFFAVYTKFDNRSKLV